MMIKKNLKTMIITSIVILLPILVGIYLWDQLPAELATHFGTNGAPDDWSSKEFAVFGLPLILLAVHWFSVAVIGADPKRENISDKMTTLVIWLVPIVSIVGCGSTYLYELDNSANITGIGLLLLGCVFLVIGNYLPKMKQSYTLGIKLPWTLNSEENWNRTHRMASRLWILCGFLTLVVGFTQFYWLMVVIAVLAVFVPAVYSYILFKKGI